MDIESPEEMRRASDRPLQSSWALADRRAGGIGRPWPPCPVAGLGGIGQDCRLAAARGAHLRPGSPARTLRPKAKCPSAFFCPSYAATRNAALRNRARCGLRSRHANDGSPRRRPTCQSSRTIRDEGHRGSLRSNRTALSDRSRLQRNHVFEQIKVDQRHLSMLQPR